MTSRSAENPTVDDGPSEHVRRKTAEYGRVPSVWPAPPPHRPRKQPGRGPLALVRMFITMVVLVAGPPAALWSLFGNPIDLPPTGRELFDWLTYTQELPDSLLTTVLIWAGWLLWAVLVVLLTGSLAAAAGAWRLPRWRLPAPLHRLMFGLAGSAVITLVNTPHAGPAPDTAVVADSDAGPRRRR